MDDISRFKSIGWDFDMTLHGHPRSQEFWSYIHENPNLQKHYIVTFRTGRLFDRIWRDLADAKCPLLPFQFRGVFGVPESIYVAFVNGWLGGDEYLFWKGKICRELEIECLVDDATMEVWGGCSRYNVEYVHPDLATF